MKVNSPPLPSTLPEPAPAPARRAAGPGTGAVVKATAVSQDVRRSATAPAVPDAPEAQPADVQVALSPVARLLARHRDRIAQVEVDAARVSRVRQQLERDTYEFDSQALARALIDKELRWIRT